MKLAELVFILLFLGSVISIVQLGYLALRGRWQSARRFGLRFSGVILVYLVVVCGVALASPRKWIAIGEEQRFDDWAVTIMSAKLSRTSCLATIRIANRGRGRPQSAREAAVLLVSEKGERFEPEYEPGERSIHSVVEAGDSFEIHCQYYFPQDVNIAGLEVVHGAFPALFIVGESASLLHKKTLVKIE